MAERFERLYKLPDNLYVTGSPVIISAGALLKDNETGNIVTQLKFHSVSEKRIIAVKISVTAYDVSSKELQGVEDYQYLDLNVYIGQYFGSNKAIVMPETITRSFAISDIVVVFSDQTTWNSEKASDFSPIPAKKALQTVLSNPELIKQYQIATNMKARFIPQDTMGLWMCTCGEINGGDHCTHCTLQKNTVFSTYDISQLTEAMESRLANEKAEKEKITEQQEVERQLEAKREAELIAEKAQKKKDLLSKIKVGSIVAVCLVVCALTFVLFDSFIVPSYRYSKATNCYNSSDFESAAILFDKLDDFKDSKDRLTECQYLLAKQHIENAEYLEALDILHIWFDYKDSKDLRAIAQLGLLKDDISENVLDYSNIVSAGGGKSVLRILKNNQVVGISEYPYGQDQVSGWENVISVSVGDKHAIGLKNDGTVLSTGYSIDGRCDVSSWNNIRAISAGKDYSLGLKNDGTVIATKYNGSSSDYYGQCDVSQWKNIINISAGAYHSVGLKSDGTVIVTGDCDVSSWREIVEISAGLDHVVGLRKDGTVVATGRGGDGQCNVKDWYDIIAISAGDSHTVGLKSDGTVIAVGYNGDGRCDVSDWTDIIAIDAGENCTVGLKSDGTIVIAGDSNN